MLEQVLSRWNALAPRDRRMLAIALAFVAVVLVWRLAFDPAWMQSQRLARELPKLRADLAQVDQLAREAQQIARLGQVGVEPVQQLRNRLERSAEEAGLGPALAQLEVSGELIEARFTPVEFERWLPWLDQALRDTRLRVVDMAINRESPGSISGRLAFEAPRGAGDR